MGRALAGFGILVALGITLAGCTRDPGPASRDRIGWDHAMARMSNSMPAPAISAAAEANAQRAADRMRWASGNRGCVLQHTDGRELAADYPGIDWAENIGCYPGCADAADDATPSFLSSPTHRDNIMNPSYTYIGVGVACNDKYLFVAVQFTS